MVMVFRQAALPAIITAVLNGLDGFDLLAISFASPGIAAEWQVDHRTLGVVLSMELIGMSCGSILLGWFADKVGRRPVVVFCLVAMSLGMFMVVSVDDVPQLCAWRLMTGVGIGGMLTTITTATAEYADDAGRDRAVALMSIGYPLGVIAGGALCAVLLKSHGWRSVFYVGGSFTAVCIPLVLLCLPESQRWLAARRDRKAAPAGLRRADRTPLPSMFSPELRRFTAMSTLAYLFHIFTWFYVLKWLPTIVVGMGYSAQNAIGVLVWVNVGAIVGALALGAVSSRWGLKRVTVIAMIASAFAVAMIGGAPMNILQLSCLAAVAGLCITAGIVGVYATFARGFPTRVRASGTGFGMGVGRIGSACAPIGAGLLLQHGLSVPTVSVVMASGSLLAGVSIWALRFPTGDELS